VFEGAACHTIAIVVISDRVPIDIRPARGRFEFEGVDPFG
jgi:hypothetical protein